MLVKMASAGGIPHEKIAEMLDISENTLRKHYRRELTKGRTEANVMVMGALFKAATGSGRNAVTAAIFWLKSQAGWKDNGDSVGGPSVEIKLNKSDFGL
jgi:hypothetical protein